MKRTSRVTKLALVTLAASAAVVGVTACEGSDAASNQSATPAPPSAAAERPVDVPVQPSTSHAPAIAPAPGVPHTSDAEAVYLAVLRNVGTVPGTSEQQLELGHLVCDNFDSGMSLTTQSLVAIESGVEDWFGSVVGAAVPAFCPEHQDEIDNFQEQWG